jgi:hypothetical protein
LSFGADSVIVVCAAGVPVVSVLPNATTAAPTPKLRTTAMIMAIQPNSFGLGAATAAGLAVSAGQEIFGGWDIDNPLWKPRCGPGGQDGLELLFEWGYSAIVIFGGDMQSRNGQLNGGCFAVWVDDRSDLLTN